MAYFQAKIGLKKLKKKENKNYLIASFQAKIGWKRSRKRENKNCPFVPFQPDVLQKIKKKNSKKVEKIQKNCYGFYFKPKQVGKG